MIVDTSALVAVAGNEPGYEKLFDALLTEDSLLPALALVEYYRVRALQDNRPDPDAVALITGLVNGRARIEPFTAADAHSVPVANERFGSGNGRGGKLNMLDLMVYAVAQRTGRPILFTGGDFPTTDALLHPASRRN